MATTSRFLDARTIPEIIAHPDVFLRLARQLDAMDVPSAIAVADVAEAVRASERTRAAMGALAVVAISIMAHGATASGLIAALLPDRLVANGATGIVGGERGMPFDDRDSVSGPVRRIQVSHGGLIDSIQFGWDDPAAPGAIRWGVRHGGHGGMLTEFTLDPDDHIVAIEGSAGNSIDRIAFVTANGARHGPVGGVGGTPFRLVPDIPGDPIVALYGHSGSAIDAIGAVSASHDPTHAGGMGGVPSVDEVAPTARIRRVDVFAGAYIDAIQTTYTIDGSPQAGRRFGGDGGVCHTLDLTDREVIVAVEVNHGDYVDGLRFVVRDVATDIDRAWPPRDFPAIGGNRGRHDRTLSAPPGQHVTALWVRAGGYIDGIGICVG